MARLAKLTAADREAVYINPLTVGWVRRLEGLTRIVYAGGPEDYVDVRETLDETISALNNGLAG